MADPDLGGKGRIAPYTSTLVRVPLPLKPLVAAVIYEKAESLGRQHRSVGEIACKPDAERFSLIRIRTIYLLTI